ncbi:MAG: hypothetical protein KF784_02290 [Fimbriimonadaceae bacterium]|nr:hypothetical protein [Fimbriimonadaceae bacterium]
MDLFKLGFRGFLELIRALLSETYPGITFEKAPPDLIDAGINIVAHTSDETHSCVKRLAISCHRLHYVRRSDCDRIASNLRNARSNYDSLVLAFTCSLKPNIEHYIRSLLTDNDQTEVTILSESNLLSSGLDVKKWNIASAFLEMANLEKNLFIESLTQGKDEISSIIGDIGFADYSIYINTGKHTNDSHKLEYNLIRREPNGDLAVIYGRYYASVDPITLKWDAIFSFDLSNPDVSEDATLKSLVLNQFLKQPKPHRHLIEIEALIKVSAIEKITAPSPKDGIYLPTIHMRKTEDSIFTFSETSIIGYPLKKRSHSLCLPECARIQVFEPQERQFKQLFHPDI